MSGRRPSRSASHSALYREGTGVHQLSSIASGGCSKQQKDVRRHSDQKPVVGTQGTNHSKQRRSSAPDIFKGSSPAHGANGNLSHLSRPRSATGLRRPSLSEALDQAQDFIHGQLQQGRWRPRTPSKPPQCGVKVEPKHLKDRFAELEVTREPVPTAEDRGLPRSPKNSAWEALPPTPAVEVMTPDAAQVEHAPAREGSRLSEGVTLDDQHHKDFATVWSSVWFRTQVKHPQLGRELTKSSLGWAEGSQKGILQRLSCKMAARTTGQHKDPGKALQLVVASSGLMPAWLPESLDVEDEDDLSDALGQVTGTVFRHWCHARESEIRVDDLLLILGDLGIEAHQELLEKALAGNIYATLDWPDFVSLLKDYRHLERQYHRKLFDEICRSEGSLSVEEVEVLLDRLGHPAALQAFDKCRKDRTSHMNFGAFEEFLRQLRLTEGFSQHDLRELHAFFEVEKTCAARLRKEPMCRCSLEKVQQVMMLRGFPTTEEEVQQMAEKMGFSSEHGVRFRQMLRLIRCLKDLERTQMLEIIQKYSQERRNAIQVVDLPLALGGLGYYPDEDAIQEHLLAIGERESEECLTPEELARFLQKYRQVSGFTREQYHNLAQSFSKADKTKRGQLNALELTEVLRRAGFHVSMQDVIQALYHFDLEGIGLLSLPEVLKLLRGLLAKEAETRRNAFLAACRGPSQKLPARDLAATIARVRGYQPDKTVLTSMLSILGLHSMGLSFTSFEHVCKLMRESDVKFMQNHSGYTPEQVAELKVHYQSYDPDDHGFIAGAKLPQLFLDAFPMYSTSTRQQQITKNYMEEVNQTYNGWTFEAFLGFVRMAEDEACHQDLLDEEQLVQDHALRAEECRGFREIFISKADHNCAVTDEDILDMFDFATAEFNQEQRMKFFQVLKGVDRHYYGTALRFPDFLRFMKRLTEKQTEENLGLVRASLRLKRLEDEADAWARACRVVKRGMIRAGSLFFKTELEVQRIKSQSSQGSEKAVPAVP
mmetsp:Transcript_21823/g.47864  ORF Transcript_21823/g.47864 Transcript_21823/m.47864 type:complete len:995 (-) Transcript_21823:71-3055(-)